MSVDLCAAASGYPERAGRAKQSRQAPRGAAHRAVSYIKFELYVRAGTFAKIFFNTRKANRDKDFRKNRHI